MFSRHRQTSGELIALGLLVVLTFLVFMPVLGFDLLWDDLKIATDQAKYRVDDASDLGEQLTTALPFSANYWRPLPMATFLLQINLGLSDALTMHLVSLVLHCLNAVVLFKLLGLIDRPASWTPRFANFVRLAATAVFVLHPVMAEPVAWVSSRFDLMMTLLSLILLFVLFGVRQSGVRLLLVFALTLMALLCKEQAVMLLPAYPLLAVVFQQGAIRRTGWQRIDLEIDRRAYAAMAVAFLSYLALRWNALGYLLVPEPLGFDLSPIEHLLVFGATAFHAWGLMLVPFGWAGGMHFVDAPVNATDPSLWLQLGIVVAGVLVGLVSLLRPVAVGAWGAGVAVIWLVLLPILNIKPLVALSANMLVGDRFLVLPVAMLVLVGYRLICERGDRLPGNRPVVVAIVVAWFLGAAVNTSYLLPNWADEHSLWRSWLASAPKAAWLRANVARELLLKEDYAAAETQAKEAVAQLKGQASQSMTRRWELGRSLSIASIAVFEQGLSTEAIELMQEAARIDVPFAALYHALLGRYYLRLDDTAAAHREMVQVVRLSGYQQMKRMHSVSYINLGVLALEGRDWRSAGLLFREGYYNLSGGAWAAELPDSPGAWQRLSEDLKQAKLLKASAAAAALAGTLQSAR
jgi:hypothetical protein